MEMVPDGNTLSDAELLRRQDALQAEARRVLAELDLIAVLGAIGQPEIVGSLVYGLMVWRDIDIEVQCPNLSADLAFETARPLVSHPGLHRMNYRDWSGPRAIADLPDGYYWGIRYQPPGAEEWKLDIWLLPEGTTRRTGVELAASLPRRLTAETRLAILRLKDTWFRRPSYRDQVQSIDIYDAVLEHGVRTAGEFERYLRDRGIA